MQQRSGGHTSSFRPREVGVHCLCATPRGPVVRFRCLVLAGSGNQKANVGCGVECYGNCRQVGRGQNWRRRLMILIPSPPNQYPLSTKLTNQRPCMQRRISASKMSLPLPKNSSRPFETLHQSDVIHVEGIHLILLKPSFLLPNIPLLPHLVDIGQLYFS